MPNPNNRLKLTGDTHLPDVNDIEGRDDDLTQLDVVTDIDDVAMAARAEPMAGRISPSSHRTAAMPFDMGEIGNSISDYTESAREQVRNKPFATLGGAFALGFVLAKLFR